nr:lipid particle protein [Cryptococcus depauperatus CBS 7855]
MSIDVYLVLLIHGLWGNPSHLSAAKEELQAAWKGEVDWRNISGSAEDPVILEGQKDENSREELVIMIASGMTSQLTYDGVDVCASRVAWELDQKVDELKQSGKNVIKFSVTGYSLGGLVARYLVGLLHSRKPSFFDIHKPVSFATLSTPHYGIPKYNTFLSTVLCWLGARIMSRSGEQLYVVDMYSPEDPRPLLEIMADPRSVFFQGLEKFERLSIFASAVNDDSVPYPSAAIETLDHFAQWERQGIAVDTDSAGIIKSWSKDGTEVKYVERSWSDRFGTLPPVLRYRFPFNYLILFLFPVMLPLIIILILARQSLDSSRSKRRLQQLAKTSNPAEYQPTSASGLSIQKLREIIRHIERELESDLIQNAEGPSFETIKTKVPPQEVTIKVQLKDSQLRMAYWLNTLPLRKYLSWWPEVANAHATAIVRDPHLFPAHERGRGMLKLWAKVVLGQNTADS